MASGTPQYYSPMEMMLPYGGMQMGSALLGALAGNPYDKYNKAGLRHMQSTLRRNPDVINVQGAINRNRANMIPQMNQMGAGINRRFGFDTGRGQGQLMRMLMEQEGGFNLDASMQNDQLKSQRNTRLASALAGAGGY